MVQSSFVVETWLKRNSLITVSQNPKVLPIFPEKFAHNLGCPHNDLHSNSSARGCSVFPSLSLTHTFASRLSAGGVSDHFVTLMLRQGDSQVFKRYSQAKLNMMREALAQMDRHANEPSKTFGTGRPN